MKPLTAPQMDELRRLAREPQHTFGRARTRVQNSLVGKGLARYEDDGTLCLITDAGRLAATGGAT